LKSAHIGAPDVFQSGVDLGSVCVVEHFLRWHTINVNLSDIGRQNIATEDESRFVRIQDTIVGIYGSRQ